MRVASVRRLTRGRQPLTFLVFLQALVLLGQLWGHDGQGVERVREIRAEDFRETNPGWMFLCPLPTFPELSPWVVSQLWQKYWGGGCPIPQGCLRDSGRGAGVPGWVSIAREALRVPTSSLLQRGSNRAEVTRIIKLSKEAAGACR